MERPFNVERKCKDMKINLLVRIKNPVFWLTIIPATTAFVYAVLGCFGVVPGISEEVIINALVSIVTGLTTLGVLVDPTTKGVGDGELGYSYTEPH